MKIKAWITRRSAMSIQFGGLERCFVHFTKPVYFLEKLSEKDRDTPFGDIHEMEGLYKKYGWHEPEAKTWVPCLSVGNWLGYENPISEKIWKELQNHFGNAPFDKWHEVERDGLAKVEDFLFEIELSINHT